MKSKLKGYLIILGTVAALISCKNRPADESGMDQFRFDEGDVLTSVEITKSFIYLFPSPGEVLERFKDADITYSGPLLHSPDESQKYLTTRDKALNLGVYISDMAYTSMFSRNMEAVEYLKTIQRMSAEIDISNAVFQSLLERAESNIGNSDSMVVIGNEVFFNMVEFLESGGKEQTVAVISCGAYVEALYLALNSIGEFEAGHPVLEQIAELKYPVENLKNNAENVGDQEAMENVLNYLESLENVFGELQSASSEPSVDKDEAGVLTLKGGPDLEITEENYSALKNEVNSIRGLIIGS